VKMLRPVPPTPLQKSSQLDVQHVHVGSPNGSPLDAAPVNGRVDRFLETVMRRFIIVAWSHFVEPAKLSLKLASIYS